MSCELGSWSHVFQHNLEFLVQVAFCIKEQARSFKADYFWKILYGKYLPVMFISIFIFMNLFNFTGNLLKSYKG